MAAATTIAIIGGAALAAGASVYSAERQAGAAKKGREMQEAAQRQNLAMAAARQRESEAAFAARQKKLPDMSAIMASAARGATQGAAATNLTGARTTTMLGE